MSEVTTSRAASSASSNPGQRTRGDTIIIYISVLIQSLLLCTAKSHDEYTGEDITQKLESYCTKYRRVDTVFDVYKSTSLKSENRSKRENGRRTGVTGTSKKPNS